MSRGGSRRRNWSVRYTLPSVGSSTYVQTSVGVASARFGSLVAAYSSKSARPSRSRSAVAPACVGSFATAANLLYCQAAKGGSVRLTEALVIAPTLPFTGLVRLTLKDLLAAMTGLLSTGTLIVFGAVSPSTQ